MSVRNLIVHLDCLLPKSVPSLALVGPRASRYTTTLTFHFFRGQACNSLYSGSKSRLLIETKYAPGNASLQQLDSINSEFKVISPKSAKMI